jgi:hypothetical protein
MLYFLVSLLSCVHKKTEPEIKENTAVQFPKTDTTHEPQPATAVSINLDLVPMIIGDSGQQDPYKKYAVDFQGICYSCDAANISITDNRLFLVNACDSGKKKTIVLDSVEKTGENIIARSPDLMLKLEKIKGAGLYQLRFEGRSPATKDLRINQFFCIRNELTKFRDHDCEDFEG